MNMYRGGSSRIFPALLILVVMVVAIIALVAVGRAIFGGSETPPEESPSRRTLLTTDADHSVRMSVRGPLVADEEFRSYMIDISPVGRTMTTYAGYQPRQIETTELGNTTEAYVEFVNALDKADFLKEAELSDEEDDTRGVCATGRLYTFEIMQAQSDIKRLWASSCRESAGSFRGKAEKVRALFLSQIPENQTLLRTINISR